MKQKLFSMLALLLMAVTGAWAQTEELLTTITATGKDTYSETTAGVVTVSHDNDNFNNTFGWLWFDHAGSVTVEAKDGYTITKCVFRQANKTPFTVSTAPFKVDFIETSDPDTPEFKQYLCQGYMDGVSSIEVYGYAPAATTGYSVTLKDDTEDATNWKAKVGNDELQALPLTGLSGDGTETVTVTYNGEKKVKSVKAVKKAAAAVITTLDNPITAWTAGSYAVPAGGLTYSDAITVSGDVTLVLTDGETLTLNKGISLAEGATLTIQGNGTMNINGTNNSTASTVAGTGMLVLTSGTLNAKGGNGDGLIITVDWLDIENNIGVSGGVAINGNVTVNGGTVTATGGNGGDLDTSEIVGGYNNHGGNGGAAISGNVTVNAGGWTATNGSNGTYTPGSDDNGCSAGTGGKAVAGTVTDNR